MLYAGKRQTGGCCGANPQKGAAEGHDSRESAKAAGVRASGTVDTITRSVLCVWQARSHVEGLPSKPTQ